MTLVHYGVKGMKWGVRRIRNNPAKALRKYNRKNAKAIKYMKNAYRYAGESQGLPVVDKSTWGRMNSAALIQKSNQAYAKALKYDKKAQTWFKKMETALKDTPYDLTTPESRRRQDDAKSFIRQSVESEFWKGYAKPIAKRDKKRNSSTTVGRFT